MVWILLKLHKGDQLFKFINKFRCLGITDLRQEFLIENSSVNVKSLETKTEENAAGEYLLSITEIVNSVQQIGTGAPLVFINYISMTNLGHGLYMFIWFAE